ncbi:hypothetical protein J2T17_007120 [Paenibacillus mucilaginosus]|uniref:hypothetical protein n=1 Tax=Paenibacillus mucilaginosus TaxID=61624 RepID=UPI003D2179E8
MSRKYRPNVPVPDTNAILVDQMRAHIVRSSDYISKTSVGQLQFFAKDGEIRMFMNPEEETVFSLGDEEELGGLSRKGLQWMLVELEKALMAKETVLYADIIINYEADEDGGLAYLELNVRYQDHFDHAS